MESKERRRAKELKEMCMVRAAVAEEEIDGVAGEGEGEGVS